MIKVQNKGVVRELAWKTYQTNRKRNLLTIFAILLTTFLIASVTALGVSYWRTLQERNVRMSGMDYDMELSEPSEEQVETIRSMKQFAYAGLSIRCAILTQYEDKMLEKTRLHWIDETCWEKQKLPAVEYYKGHYPKAKHEIMLSVAALRAMGIDTPEIGMKLPLTWYSLAEQAEEEETDPLAENLKSEFILCGWYLDYKNSSEGYVSREFCEFTGVKQTDFTKGILYLIIRLQDRKFKQD